MLYEGLTTHTARKRRFKVWLIVGYFINVDISLDIFLLQVLVM